MISSTIPSTKYSCSGSPDIFVNGRTAIEGLSGNLGVAAGAIGADGLRLRRGLRLCGDTDRQ